MLLVPLRFAVPLLMLLDLAAFLAAGLHSRRHVRLAEVGALAPFMLAGMAAGLMLLIGVAERGLLAALGLFLLAYAGYGLSRRGAPPTLARAWCVPIGLAGGVFSALFGTGGVLFALYNAGRIRDKDALRATNAGMLMLTSIVRLVLFGAAGLLTQEGLPAAAAMLLVPMFAGTWLGGRLHAAVHADVVVKAVYALLVISGLTLLARSL